MSSRIMDRIERVSDDHYVGWWACEGGLENSYLYIDIREGTMRISCCEGERGERRVSFIVDRTKASDIVRSAAWALGLEPADGRTGEEVVSQIKRMQDFLCEKGLFAAYSDWAMENPSGISDELPKTKS